MKESSPTRQLSIDVIRGLAILLMIQVHFVGNLSANVDPQTWLYQISSWLGVVPAPLFTFISGVSYQLWLRKQVLLGRKDVEINKISVRRGLFLFGAGIAFNVFVWMPEDTFDWDILTLIGTSLLLLTVARHLPSGVLILICFLVLLLSPPLRTAAEYSAYWHEDMYEYDFNLSEIGLGFLLNGYFPLLPWIVFPLLGFVVGAALNDRPTVVRPRTLLLAGLALLGLSALSLCFRSSFPTVLGENYVTGITMYPASTAYVLGIIGVNLVALILLRYWLDRDTAAKGSSFIAEFFRLFSAYSLTIYILHHMAHLWPLWICGAILEDNDEYFWRNACSTPISLALAALCTLLCYLLVRFLDQHGKYGFEKVMRWVCE